jgi:ABC-type uncharacterized transport system involved in gliding motility auxiliary subunit
MTKIAKICLALSVLFFIGAGVTRFMLGSMGPGVYAPLALGLISLAAVFVIDYKFYYDFFALKTTKHGLNMGWLIVMAIVTVFIANFLAVRYEKKWDVTKEGLNSLSEQSTKVLGSLKADVNFILLYSKAEQAEAIRKRVADVIQLYHEKSSKVKFEGYSALSRPDLAQKYEFKSGEMALFAEYQDKHLKVDNVSEEGITKILMKLTRDQANRKTIYFTSGHGERELEGEKPDAASSFKADLEITYNVKTLKLIESDVPADAAALVILGPNQIFLPAEIAKLKSFAKAGGHFFIAADPGEKNNIQEIDQIFGVDYHNDYILDTRVQAGRVGPIIALGSVHSKTSDITRSVADQLFLLASSLSKSAHAPPEFKFEDLVSTNESTKAVAKLEQNPKFLSTGPHVVIMKSSGRLDGSDKEFSAIVAGDTDFATNQLYSQYGDKDILMNSISSLAKDDDLISIHAKTPKATKIELVGNYKNFLALFLLLAPIGMIISSGVIWWRRRTA